MHFSKASIPTNVEKLVFNIIHKCTITKLMYQKAINNRICLPLLFETVRLKNSCFWPIHGKITSVDNHYCKLCMTKLSQKVCIVFCGTKIEIVVQQCTVHRKNYMRGLRFVRFVVILDFISFLLGYLTAREGSLKDMGKYNTRIIGIHYCNHEKQSIAKSRAFFHGI